jgi:hypothetical protein
MEALLTLVIAVGGVATGIGAIWTAMVARRQAQLTERSLSEQNERLRLSLELDLLTRLEDRFESPHFLSRRRVATKCLLDNAFVEEDVVEVGRLSRAAYHPPWHHERLPGASLKCTIYYHGVLTGLLGCVSRTSENTLLAKFKRMAHLPRRPGPDGLPYEGRNTSSA